MPTTRKKIIKTVYKNEDSGDESGDFSDSGSEAKISDEEYSTNDEVEHDISSGDEFKNTKTKQNKAKSIRKKTFSKSLLGKLHKTQMSVASENENIDTSPAIFSVKDLTDADKLLPPVLNLSESDSSDDEVPITKKPMKAPVPEPVPGPYVESDNENKIEYTDVWSKNIQDGSDEIAKSKFFELGQHQTKLEEAKASILNYSTKLHKDKESDVKDLLALGEEVVPTTSPIKKKVKSRRIKEDSDSDLEDWEEVKENKAIPQQGLQLIVDIPGSVCRKSKKLDVEMMMKRKMNRVKKEYQVYMHKVHVLCWLGHGNYVSRVLNDQEVMAAALKMVPGKECYPGERVDMKYVEQITNWYKEKLILKQDKYEEKFRPKAPPLKKILLEQIKNKVVTTKKYRVFIFVSMLRALGLQCRVMLNFVTLPIKPPSSELCSLSTKQKDDNNTSNKKSEPAKSNSTKSNENSTKKGKSNLKLSQLDGNDDNMCNANYEFILQLDGSNDTLTVQTRRTRSTKAKSTINEHDISKEDVSPPKRSRKNLSPNTAKNLSKTKQNPNNGDNIIVQDKNKTNLKSNNKELVVKNTTIHTTQNTVGNNHDTNKNNSNNPSPRKPRNNRNKTCSNNLDEKESLPLNSRTKTKPPTIVVSSQSENVSSEYFDNKRNASDKSRLSRKRSQTINPTTSKKPIESNDTIKVIKPKTRTKSAPIKPETSKYFSDSDDRLTPKKKPKVQLNSKSIKKEKSDLEDTKRVSHRDLRKPKNDVTADLINIIKGRVKEAKEDTKRYIVKGKVKEESDDSDFLPEENLKHKSESDDDFKPSKISPKPSTSRIRKTSTGRKIDRRVVSSDDEATQQNKVNVWCEIFVEELEQWVSVDVITGKIHCSEHIYRHATHPVCYIVGWDNNNNLKDVTRRYVPHWNTVTRKQRAEPVWWNTAIAPWLGSKTARDREEDQYLDRMQLEAPLPKSIAEYKNHPLYALKRHLLKYEAIYPPDAATLGFVRNEPVYARECVYICRSRDTWLKEAKVVRLGEAPYKIVKARPKWDKLSNRVITDKPLEIFGPWQVQDYEPPVAENGIVPRNAYGNVELFKDCMLPKGTVHIKLPGLNKVARKLNIDCAPAMTGFDFNGGWSHPVYDGFVVCKEFEEIITDAWIKDQEEQERKEKEKTEARVYGNWKRLIKGLLIRERLRNKYGFEEPSTSQNSKKSKGPRLVVRKRS